MPMNKDLKRLVRTRMEKTGESYTTARSHIVKSSAIELADLAGMSDAAVKKATGHDWKKWTGILDKAGADKLSHRDIARHVGDTYPDIGGWWAQMVTVGYERIRGLREKGQGSGGDFQVNKSKTLPVTITTLYDAFSARKRKRWLGDAEITVKKATREKSMRLTWEDGRPVEVYFWEKGPAKSQVQLQHSKFSTKAEADEARADWTERLARLTEMLKS